VYEESLIEEVNHWQEMNATLSSDTAEEKKPLTNNVIRKKCYQTFIALHYGHLGRKKREKISLCVTTSIREEYPDSNGNYMGFKDA
jgi:hypothetical protein